jgi:hypothetical protein
LIDIIDDKSIQKAVEKVEQSLNGKHLNCLINNAGMATKLRFSNINEKDMMETYRQNVIGPWKVTKVYLTISFSIDILCQFYKPFLSRNLIKIVFFCIKFVKLTFSFISGIFTPA